jgi:hypothetical protein
LRLPDEHPGLAGKIDETNQLSAEQKEELLKLIDSCIADLPGERQAKGAGDG